MKKNLMLFIVITAVLFFTACTTSKRVIEFLNSPNDTSFVSNINIEELEIKYSEYDGVFLKVKNLFDHSATTGNPWVRGNWSYHRVNTFKYVIFNTENTSLSTITFNTHPKAKINSFYLVVKNPDNAITRYSLNDLIAEKDAKGYLIYKFALPNIKKGSLVEYGTDLTYNSVYVRPPLEYDVELQYEFPCEDLQLEFAYPDWWKIKTKNIAKNSSIDYKEIHKIEEKKRVLSYYAVNIDPIVSEQYSPYFKDLAKYLRWNITDIDLSMPVQIIKGWKSIADDYKNYAMNKETFLTTSVGNKTDDLIENCKTTEEKMEAIVDFLQQNIKSVFDSKDRSFSTVLKEGQGNPYEICGLAESMLSKAELTTDYLLIHSATTGYIDREFVCYDEFQVPAIRVKIGSQDYVVFPYLKFLPIDHIPEDFQNQEALIVSNDEVKNGTFWELPSGKMANNLIREIYDIRLNQDASLQVVEEKLIDGAFAYDIRKKFDELTKEEIEKEIKEMLTYTQGNITLSDYNIENRKEPKNPLKITIKYLIDNLLTITPEETIFQTGGLLSPSSLKKQKLNEENRKNPVVVKYDQFFEKSIRIHFPSNWIIENKQADFTFENEFGNITGSYIYSEGELKIDQKSYLKKNSSSKESISELAKIIGKTTKLDVPTIVFSNSEM